MKIGVDIDGTITNLHNEIIKYGLQYNDYILGKGIKNENAYRISEIFDWEKDDYVKFKKYIQMEVLNIIKPRDDAVEYLNNIKKLGHEIYIITGRKSTEMRDTYNETLNWLKINNIPFDKFIIEEANKGKACLENNIDIFVDDSLKHLNRIYDAGIKKIYIFDNESIFESVFRVELSPKYDKRDFLRNGTWIIKNPKATIGMKQNMELLECF